MEKKKRKQKKKKEKEETQVLVKDLRGSDGAKMSYVAQLVYLCFFTSRIAGLLCLPTVKVFHFSHPVHKALKRSIFRQRKKKISLSYVSVCKCVCVCVTSLL